METLTPEIEKGLITLFRVEGTTRMPREKVQPIYDWLQAQGIIINGMIKLSDAQWDTIMGRDTAHNQQSQK